MRFERSFEFKIWRDFSFPVELKVASREAILLIGTGWNREVRVAGNGFALCKTAIECEIVSAVLKPVPETVRINLDDFSSAFPIAKSIDLSWIGVVRLIPIECKLFLLFSVLNPRTGGHACEITYGRVLTRVLKITRSPL